MSRYTVREDWFYEAVDQGAMTSYVSVSKKEILEKGSAPEKFNLEFSVGWLDHIGVNPSEVEQVVYNYLNEKINGTKNQGLNREEQAQKLFEEMDDYYDDIVALAIKKYIKDKTPESYSLFEAVDTYFKDRFDDE